MGAWPSLAHPLLDALMRFALATPDITRLAALRAVWRVCLALSGGAAALLLTLAGGAVAAGAAGM
ncbi:MAG: hypothetical protein K6V73_08880 [Firmicutes bacterium]|nr:hypothetical protein [Bacillota bacterium]